MDSIYHTATYIEFSAIKSDFFSKVITYQLFHNGSKTINEANYSQLTNSNFKTSTYKRMSLKPSYKQNSRKQGTEMMSEDRYFKII